MIFILEYITCENHSWITSLITKNLLFTVSLTSFYIFFNILRLRQNGRHLADNLFKCIFLNENMWIWIKISLKFGPKGPINHIPSLVQIMASCQPGDKPSSEMMIRLPTHICITQTQWVKFHGLNFSWEKRSHFDTLTLKILLGMINDFCLSICFIQKSGNPISIFYLYFN